MKRMTRVLNLAAALLLFLAYQASAQTPDSLREKIQQIISARNATVGVSIVSGNGKDTLSFNGDRRFPMQSVFKFHIALAALSQVDAGKLSLAQKIKIGKKDLLPGLHSPLREKYPNGATLPLAEIIHYTVSHSDNVGCDALLRLLGGPQGVESYFSGKGFRDLSIKINEEVMQNDWDLQFQNWTTPKAATKVLEAFYRNKGKLLSPESHSLVWKEMRENETGKKRLKGLLPRGTVVAHKTGSSGANKATGITAAVNDIGIVFLPNGEYFFISVFVSDSKEDPETNEKIIADISKAAWGFFNTEG
ncbi:class A beta-lactamase, subclass A2 [Sabulibacter ruber]|uniref:class A beta-lactamase, subclass A2 n=1 Tax=Sabulibacter ruber TaxID=2811901 RepID=UPI001F61AC82|nr:class A beta-lactamase, subclass A2 [Sabulibacter ruber]